jgi:hypothetical protein
VKLTAPEYRLIDQLDRVVHNTMNIDWLNPSTLAMARRMKTKGLLRKREWNRGSIRATQAGLRSWFAFKATKEHS